MTRHKLHCWDARSGNETKLPISEHSGVAGSAVFSPDGRRIVSGSHDSAICIWDSETGQLIGLPMQGHSQDVWSVAPPQMDVVWFQVAVTGLSVSGTQ